MNDVNKELEVALNASITKSLKAGVKALDTKSICLIKDEITFQNADIGSRELIQLTDYIPDRNKPLTFICVNLHIFQNSAGTRNFSKSNVAEFKQTFEWINQIYSNHSVPTYTGICTSKPVLLQQQDTKLRFILNKVVFYTNNGLCNQGYVDGYSLLLNAMLQKDSSMDDQLNIFLTAPNDAQPAFGYASALPSSNMSVKQYIHTFASPPYASVDYMYSKHWAHELGHILGLSHTYGGANCSSSDPFYLYDIHGCPPNKVCPITQSINNLMGGHESCSISTLQSALMHYNLANRSVKRYADNLCCPKCVAFGARIDRHISQGSETLLEYTTTLANESCAWDGKLFTCPVDGVYNFNASFQKDSLVQGGTPNNVWLYILSDRDIIGTIMSEKADLKSNWSPGAQQFGRRDSVSFTVNIKLKKGTIVKTMVNSDNDEKRNIVDVTFCGQLLCSSCC